MLVVGNKSIPQESKLFAQKVARSIIEIQPKVNNIADIAVFLEVLGYNKEIIQKYGFNDSYDLANYVYDFIDVYEIPDESKKKFVQSSTIEIPSLQRRVAEGVSLVFPWLASLAILFVAGVSLWMAWNLPIQIATAFIIGIFLGMAIAEAPIQAFSKLFTFYHEQKNIGEVKRLLKRSYELIGVILAGTVCLLYLIGYLERIPSGLVLVTTVSTITISLHRASYMIIFALKKIAYSIITYSVALISLLSTYYLTDRFIPDGTTRYFVALVIAFVTLSFFAIFQHYKLTKNSSAAAQMAGKPHFYNPISRTDKTIKSRFGVQLWETLPYMLYGIFFFIIMFSDRILSWIHNPIIVKSGISLPMLFNPVYHVGADMAWAVLFPTYIVQYVMMAPIFSYIHNLTLNYNVSEISSVNSFIHNKYKKLLLATILTSAVTAGILNLGAPLIMSHFGYSQVSLHILQFASISDVFLSIFAANSLFMMLLNKVKILVILSMACAAIVTIGGIIVVQFGFENLVFAYLASSVVAALVSTIYSKKMLRNPASSLFGRFV